MLYALMLGFVVFVLVGLLDMIRYGVVHLVSHAKEIIAVIKNLPQTFRNFPLRKAINAEKQWFKTFPKNVKCFFGRPHIRDFMEVLVKDLFIGISMAMAFLFWLHNYPFLADPEDASMDFVMQLNQCDSKTKICDFSKNENIPPITLLDIDNETHTNWGKPLITPRNHIQELIDSAVKNEARAIVVDIFMTDEIPYESDKERKYDQELYNYLASYSSKYCSNGKKCPTIILIRSLRLEESKDTFYVNKQPVFRVQPSFLDKAVEQSTPHIQWASPKFVISDFDNTVRRWWLWQPICDDNKPQIMPSIHLLVSAIVSDKRDDVGETLKRIECKLHNFVEKDCSNPYYKPRPLQESLSLDEALEIRTGEIAGGGIRQRIMFTMPWSSERRDDDIQTDVQTFAFSTRQGEEIVRVLNAFRYLEKMNSSKANLLKGRIKGSIVIIGSSHHDAQDMHRTPLGRMPGEFVIANAIYSFLHYGEIKGTSALTILLYKSWLIILFVMMTSFVNMLVSKFPPFFRYWRIVIIILVTAIEWFALQTWVSTKLLKEGVWFDFSIPLVAILFHHIALELKHHPHGKTE